MSDQLSIGELASRTSVAASALRYWEELGLLPPPARVAGRASAARDAIAHGLACPHTDILECPNFASGIAALLAGCSLEEAHAQIHSD